MQYFEVIIHTNHTSLSLVQWGQGWWSESKAAACSGYRLLKKTSPTLRRECSRWFLLGTILRVRWTMAAMTSTVRGVTPGILQPRKPRAVLSYSKDGLQGGVFQAAASLSHCGGKREMLAKELPLLHSALETSIGPGH